MGEKNAHPRLKEQFKGNGFEAKKNALDKRRLHEREMQVKKVEHEELEQGLNCPPE